jgi:hypothetical protein
MRTAAPAPVDQDLDARRGEAPDAETQWQIDREGDTGEF